MVVCSRLAVTDNPSCCSHHKLQSNDHLLLFYDELHCNQPVSLITYKHCDCFYKNLSCVVNKVLQASFKATITNLKSTAGVSNRVT